MVAPVGPPPQWGLSDGPPPLSPRGLPRGLHVVCSMCCICCVCSVVGSLVANPVCLLVDIERRSTSVGWATPPKDCDSVELLDAIGLVHVLLSQERALTGRASLVDRSVCFKNRRVWGVKRRRVWMGVPLCEMLFTQVVKRWRCLWVSPLV